MLSSERDGVSNTSTAVAEFIATAMTPPVLLSQSMVSTVPLSGVLQLKVDLDPTFALMTGSTRGSGRWRERVQNRDDIN